MATVLEIVNNALFEAKESPITQEEYDNDLTKAAKGASARYVSIKRQVLHSYFWKIAERSIRLSPETITEAAADSLYGITLDGAPSYFGDTFRLYEKESGVYYQAPPNRYTRQFAKPDDLLRIRMVADVNDELIDSKVSGDFILSDESEIYLTYTYDLDEEDIDETLANVISLFLAASLSNWLGESDLTPALENKALRAWRLAKNADAQQDPSRVFQSTDWLQGRIYDVNNPYPFILQ